MTAAGAGNDLLSAALAYAARGMAVFPLAVGDKIPISKEAGGHGVLDATTDAAQIRAWWTATPCANIGVAAGVSGLLLVDVDAKDGRDGFTAWEVLRVEHPFDDTTPHVWTPNDGKHLYFVAPPGSQLRNTDDKLGPGIETKANGKYCVAPPSRLHDGRVYRWDERFNLDTVPIAPLPLALCGLLKPRERADRPASRPAQPLAVTGDLATVRDALRHLDPWAGGYQWWVSILMAVHSNFPGPDGLAVAEVWADGKDGEVADKWKSFETGGGVTIGTLYHEAEQRGWLPPWRTPGNGTAPTYSPGSDEPPTWLDEDGAPVDRPFTPPARPAATPKPDLSECPPLPESAQLDPALGLNASLWLDAYINFSRQWAPGAYGGFHEAVGLWVLSTVAARRVKLDFGGERYPSLYIANVARSSLWTKSTAHHIGSALLDACGLSFLLAPDEATPQALLFRMSVPPTVTDWDAKPADEQERARLALAFAGQKGWDYDEFGSKVSAMMRDNSTMADFRGILRRFDDAPDRYVYDTVGRGENRLTSPYLALLASMPPANMAPYAKRGGALWHDGFWARFAFVAPGRGDQPPAGEFPEGPRVMPPNLTQSLRAWNDRLGVPDVDVVQRKDIDGKPTRDYDVTVTARPPEVCTLGVGVREAFYRYYSGLRGLAAASDNTDLDANYSRFAEKALRVAILLASLENRGVIELRHWARAQEIAERWRQSLHNLYAEINRGQDEERQKEDRVIAIVRRLGMATANQVHQYAPNISTTGAKTILKDLELAGALLVKGENRKHNLLYAVSESEKT